MSPLMNLKLAHWGGGDQCLHFVQVALVAGGKVVKTNYALVESQQGLQQIATDKTRNASDEPSFWSLAQFGLHLFILGHAQSLPSAAPIESMPFTS